MIVGIDLKILNIDDNMTLTETAADRETAASC